jgi:hypothetical protein
MSHRTGRSHPRSQHRGGLTTERCACGALHCARVLSAKAFVAASPQCQRRSSRLCDGSPSRVRPRGCQSAASGRERGQGLSAAGRLYVRRARGASPRTSDARSVCSSPSSSPACCLGTSCWRAPRCDAVADSLRGPRGALLRPPLASSAAIASAVRFSLNHEMTSSRCRRTRSYMLAMMASLGNRVWAYTRSSVSRWSRPRRVLRNVFQYATPGGSREWKSSLERRGAGDAAAVSAVALRERRCCKGDGDSLVAPRVASRPGGDCGGGGACTHARRQCG